jgi:hypothetical protein
MKKLLGTMLVACALVVGAVATYRLHHRAAPGAAPAATSEIAPDPAAVHYRYATTRASDATSDAAATITGTRRAPFVSRSISSRRVLSFCTSWNWTSDPLSAKASRAEVV